MKIFNILQRKGGEKEKKEKKPFIILVSSVSLLSRVYPEVDLEG